MHRRILRSDLRRARVLDERRDAGRQHPDAEARTREGLRRGAAQREPQAAALLVGQGGRQRRGGVPDAPARHARVAPRSEARPHERLLAGRQHDLADAVQARRDVRVGRAGGVRWRLHLRGRRRAFTRGPHALHARERGRPGAVRGSARAARPRRRRLEDGCRDADRRGRVVRAHAPRLAVGHAVRIPHARLRREGKVSRSRHQGTLLPGQHRSRHGDGAGVQLRVSAAERLRLGRRGAGVLRGSPAEVRPCRRAWVYTRPASSHARWVGPQPGARALFARSISAA